jgi:hypothetical protein
MRYRNLIDHRQAQARFWRGWEITLLPGFNKLGQPDK